MDPFLAFAIFVLGLAFGSFLNVCIYRLPLDLSVVKPRSACPSCKRPIASYDNLPVVSWLILRGRCRNCKTKISARYLFVELLTGALFLVCYAYFGLTLATLKYCVFGFLILGLIFTDAETKLLPDKLTLPGLALGLLFSLLVPVHDMASQFLPGVLNLPISSDISGHLFSLVDSLLGAALGASFIYGAGAAYLRWRGTEGMGFGDVKLMAMVGAFLGIKLTILTIFAASLAGSLFGLTAALYGSITLKDGRVEQSNFDTYRPLRIEEAPVVETFLVRSAAAPGGIGEAATAIVSPAVTNAIFTATGKRIRKLPIDTTLLKSTT